MKTIHPPAWHRRCRRAAHLAAILAFPIVGPAAGIAPPAFPDPDHVPNGCFVSSVAYVDRFVRAFPAERATTLTVHPRNFDGPHTIVVLTWAQVWWARDEYSGVFALECGVAETTLDRLRECAEAKLARLATRRLRQGRIEAGSDGGDERSLRRRRADIARAAALLPCRGVVVSIRCGKDELPFLFFEPDAGRVAVYDPCLGTATAETAPTDITAVVTQVARRLGYR